MKDRKMNLDRPQLSNNEIMAGKNFEAIVQNHQFMSKPFYKQTWFFGTTGLASLGLIIGSTLAFQTSSDASANSTQNYSTDAPPNLIVANNQLILTGSNSHDEWTELAKSTIQFKPQKQVVIAEISTQEEKRSPEKKSDEVVHLEEALVFSSTPPEVQSQTIEASSLNQDETKKSSIMDLYPRISDKIGGTISRNELLDNNGITTEGDVNIIHFELHLIDGLGGKVYSEDGNQLNQEMKDALEQVGQGETIYFENIRGKVKNGTEVRLNPLRYVLMN